jgi:replicative DNA helicase
MEETKSFASAARSSGNVIPLEKGKIPPQAVDLEEAVLGAMLIDKKGVDEVIDILQAEAFY